MKFLNMEVVGQQECHSNATAMPHRASYFDVHCCIDTVNMHFGVVQLILEQRVSLLQQKVNHNKMCRSNFSWPEQKCMFTKVNRIRLGTPTFCSK